jgi:DNA-binding XRE family transcriptional regulator
MSELVRLIDDYKDAHGQPSDASVARAIGIAPQTLNSWRKRGIKEPPAVETLRQMARFFHLSYEQVVLPAALVDAGWLDHMPTVDTHESQSDTA